MHQPTVSVSQEQIDFFHENGFLAVESVSTPDEIARLREAYDRIFAERAGREEGRQFDLGGTDVEGKKAVLPQILSPSEFAPDLAHGLFRTNGLAIARQLLGDDAKPGGDHAIMKPASYGSATPWHQDEAYWNPELDYWRVSMWVPLQDVDIATGCMQFVPGSHRLEVVEHQPINNNPKIHGLEVVPDSVDTSTAVACPLPAGGATFHLSRTLHYAGPNTTQQVRRAYVVNFMCPHRKRSTPRSFPWKERQHTARQERAQRHAKAQATV